MGRRRGVTVVAPVLVALLVACGLLAACGGDDAKESYAQEVEGIIEPVNQSLAALSDVSTPDELANRLAEAEGDLGAAVSDLESLDVPEGVEQVNSDLITTFSDFEAELADVRKAAESGDAQALQRAASDLPEVASSFESELSRIQEDAIDAGVPVDESKGGAG